MGVLRLEVSDHLRSDLSRIHFVRVDEHVVVVDPPGIDPFGDGCGGITRCALIGCRSSH